MKLAAMIKKMCPSEAELSIPAKNCYRMVILGSSKVGKTAIVSRFLTGRFEEQYTPTIEDFHRKFYSIRGEVYQLDILDTSGNHPFPAMRRLSILTGTWLGSTRRKWGGSFARFQAFLSSLGMFLQSWEEGGGILCVHGVGNFAPCMEWTGGCRIQVLPWFFPPQVSREQVSECPCPCSHLMFLLCPQEMCSSWCSAWTTGTPLRRCSA